MMIGSSFFTPQTGPVNPLLQNVWLMVHIGFIFAGNGVFAIAFFAGVMYLIQERQIKSKRLGRLYHRLARPGGFGCLELQLSDLRVAAFDLGDAQRVDLCPLYPGHLLAVGPQRGLVSHDLAAFCRPAARPAGVRVGEAEGQP